MVNHSYFFEQPRWNMSAELMWTLGSTDTIYHMAHAHERSARLSMRQYDVMEVCSRTEEQLMMGDIIEERTHLAHTSMLDHDIEGAVRAFHGRTHTVKSEIIHLDAEWADLSGLCETIARIHRRNIKYQPK